MSDQEDLFEVYRSDRAAASNRALRGEELANAFVEAVRRSFAVMEELIADVGQALGGARYTIRLGRMVVDRNSFLRVDRTTEQFREYLRSWSQERLETGSGGMHWEARIQITDHRRVTAEIGLAVAVEWLNSRRDDELAFVEFWTTGQGMTIPSEGRAFQRALVASIVRLEEEGALTSARPRPR
jgi:hypothetical protein